MGHASFQIDDQIEDWVQDRLVPGQNKSPYYRYALKTMLEVDAELDQLYEKYEYEKRQEFIEQAVHEKVKRVQEDSTAEGHEENLKK